MSQRAEPGRLRIPAGGGEVTAAAHEPSVREGAPVILTHGAGGDLDGAGLVALAAGLADRGHLALRVNLPYRGSGRPLPPRAERMVEPFGRVASAVRERFAADAPWLVGGRSYGGRVASMAVAAGGVPFAAGLVFYSYPLHPPGKPDRVRVDHWPRVTVPTLFLQGTYDPFCDLALLEEHIGTLGAPATVHIVEGGDHGLGVAAKRSPDGRRHQEAEVVAELCGVVARWAGELD